MWIGNDHSSCAYCVTFLLRGSQKCPFIFSILQSLHVLVYLSPCWWLGKMLLFSVVGPVMILEYCDKGPMNKWLTSQKNSVSESVVENLYRFSYDIVRGMEFLASKDVSTRRKTETLSTSDNVLSASDNVSIGNTQHRQLYSPPLIKAYYATQKHFSTTDNLSIIRKTETYPPHII